MERAKVPIKISPAGMFTLSNRTFANVSFRRVVTMRANFTILFSANSKSVLTLYGFAKDGRYS